MIQVDKARRLRGRTETKMAAGMRYSGRIDDMTMDHTMIGEMQDASGPCGRTVTCHSGTLRMVR